MLNRDERTPLARLYHWERTRPIEQRYESKLPRWFQAQQRVIWED